MPVDNDQIKGLLVFPDTALACTGVMRSSADDEAEQGRGRRECLGGQFGQTVRQCWADSQPADMLATQRTQETDKVHLNK